MLSVSELSRRHWNSIFNSFLLKTSFHFILKFTFVTFMINRPLSPAGSCISWCQSNFVYSGVTYEIYSKDFSCMHCVVCNCVIAGPYVKHVHCIFAHLYLVMIQNIAPNTINHPIFNIQHFTNWPQYSIFDMFWSDGIPAMCS